MKTNLSGNYVSIYTRAQALADRVLFDVTKTSRVFAGTNCPVAVTCGAREALNSAAERSEPMRDPHMLHLSALCFALALMGDHGRKAEGSEFVFTVKLHEEAVNLRALVHGDDNGAPCVTLMLANES